MNEKQFRDFEEAVFDERDHYSLYNPINELFSLVFRNGNYVVCESLDGAKICGRLNLESFSSDTEIKEGHYDDLSWIETTDIFCFLSENQFGVEYGNDLFLFDLIEEQA